MGFTARTAVADAVFGGSLTIGREPGMQAWIDLQVRPINVVGAFQVIEVVPAAGFQVRPLKVGRLSLLVGALLGPEVHSWQLRSGGQTSRGRHVSASLEGALGFAFEVWKRHEVQLAFRAGGSNERVHSVSGREIWSRTALRVGATAGFMFGRPFR